MSAGPALTYCVFEVKMAGITTALPLLFLTSTQLYLIFLTSQSILLASFHFGNLNISNTGLYYRLYSTQIVFVYFLKKQNGGRPQLIRPTAICSLDNVMCFTLTKCLMSLNDDLGISCFAHTVKWWMTV